MSNNRRNVGGFQGKGYIALVLCAAAIGITGYLYNRTNDQPEENQPSQVLQSPEGEREDRQDVPVIATEPQTKTPAAAATEGAAAPRPKALQTTAPVEGETVFGYAMEALSYNQTTRDWRTHDGVDIAAEAGTQVVAAAEGEVYAVFEDETLGYTVVIRHEGGYTTTYSSLGQEVLVKAGDRVTMGQPIGTVGSTALVETVLGPHVHFSVTYQGGPMDPAEFLALGGAA